MRDTLSFFRPVVNHDGHTWISLADQWTSSDLREADSEDSMFIQPTPEVEIQSGDGVWLVGQTFRDKCTRIDDFGTQFADWDDLDDEYRFTTGPLEEFLELNRRIYSASVRLMHGSLFSSETLTETQEIFDVLNNLHYVPSKDQQIQRGLYYSEARQIERYQMVRAEAVIDRIVDSSDDFDKHVMRLQEDLRTQRLRETSFPSDSKWSFLNSPGVTTSSYHLDQVVKIAGTKIGKSVRPANTKWEGPSTETIRVVKGALIREIKY
ncbi:MAG: hypothetical protein L0K38_13185 [Yaniella sp.]|uniref:hypothetical protein n=1 Tax=Yaniella sp. TaxID=2773929 RepID=UPI0026496F0B|nr:hypothetical protein [Yaniella sp.]MDN6457975.1 hypothetical protein [Yaniella sp.]